MRKNVVKGLGEDLGRRKEHIKTVTFHISVKGETVTAFVKLGCAIHLWFQSLIFICDDSPSVWDMWCRKKPFRLHVCGWYS